MAPGDAQLRERMSALAGCECTLRFYRWYRYADGARERVNRSCSGSGPRFPPACNMWLPTLEMGACKGLLLRLGCKTDRGVYIERGIDDASPLAIFLHVVDSLMFLIFEYSFNRFVPPSSFFFFLRWACNIDGGLNRLNRWCKLSREHVLVKC